MVFLIDNGFSEVLQMKKCPKKVNVTVLKRMKLGLDNGSDRDILNQISSVSGISSGLENCSKLYLYKLTPTVSVHVTSKFRSLVAAMHL